MSLLTRRVTSSARIALTLAGFAALFGVQISSAQAQDAVDDADQEIEEIVVTGSRLRGVDASESLPVTVITANELQKSGAATLQSYLADQPFVTGQNINNTNTFFEGGGAGANTIGLRGLGARNTLVLINGRRTAQDGVSSLVDLNTIPTAAIKTVEVLKSGASSLYGTDAVGGVINVILNDDFSGAEVSAYFGDTIRSDDISRTELSFVLGGDDGRVNYVAGGYYAKENDAWVVDRDWAAGSGFSSGSLPGAFSLPVSLIEGGGEGNTFYTLEDTVDTATNPQDFRPFDFGIPGDRFPFQEVEPLVKPFKVVSTFANGGMLLDEQTNTRLLVDFSYSRTVDTLNSAPDRLFNFGEAPIPATNYYVQQAFGANAVDINTYFIRFLGFGPKINENDRDIFRIYTGLEGELPGEWDWRAGYNYANVTIDDNVKNRLDYRLYLDLISRTTPDAFNPFVRSLSGQFSAQEIEDLKIDYTVTEESSLRIYDALVRGPLFNLPAGNIEAAIGLEYRQSSSEFIDSTAPEPRFTAQSFRLERDILAGFAEVNVPVTERLSLTGSFRKEQEEKNNEYDITVFSGAVSFRPIDSWLIRANFAEGFVAPSTAEVAGPSFTSQPFIVDPRTGNAVQLQINVTPGANPLEPEESDVFNIGTVLSPDFLPNLTLSLDYYEIDQSNLISSVPGLIAQSILDAYVAGGGPENPSAPFFDDVDYNAARDEFEEIRVSPRNLAARKTSGIEMSLSYVTEETSTGFYSVNVALANYLEFEQQLSPDLPTEDFLGTFLGLDAYPEWRGTATLNWSNGPWEATLRETWIGEYDNVWSPEVPVLSNYFRTDVQVSYSTEQFPTISFGINNLFDQDPPTTPGLEQQYVPSLYDPRGQFGYVRLSKRFE